MSKGRCLQEALEIYRSVAWRFLKDPTMFSTPWTNCCSKWFERACYSGYRVLYETDEVASWALGWWWSLDILGRISRGGFLGLWYTDVDNLDFIMDISVRSIWGWVFSCASVPNQSPVWGMKNSGPGAYSTRVLKRFKQTIAKWAEHMIRIIENDSWVQFLVKVLSWDSTMLGPGLTLLGVWRTLIPATEFKTGCDTFLLVL